MAPMKRPAASAAGGDTKKRAAASVSTKCKGLKKAILGAQLFPENVLSMLAGNVEAILNSCKEERHKFQQQAADMVAAVIKSVEAAEEAKVAEAEAQVTSLSDEKGSRDAALETATTTLSAKKEATKIAKEAEMGAVADLKTAKRVLADAQEAQQAGDADLDAADNKKKGLETFLKDRFTQMKAGSLEEGLAKQGVAEVLKIGREYKFDASLLQSLPSAITKAPDARGSFDTLCLTQVEDEFKTNIAILTTLLAQGEPAKEERAKVVAAAEEGLTAAEQKEQSCKAAASDAKKEEREAEEALKVAKQAVKDFKPQMQAAEQAVKDAMASLQELRETAVVPLAELMEWSNQPPAAPESEPAPAEAPTATEAPAATDAPATA